MTTGRTQKPLTRTLALITGLLTAGTLLITTPAHAAAEPTTPTPTSTTTTDPSPAETAKTPEAKPQVTGGKVVISGTMRFGNKLTAEATSFTPAKTSFSYQWLRNGKSIKGATKKTYVLTSKDGGKKISVKVTAKAANHTSKTVTSKARTAKALTTAEKLLARSTSKKVCAITFSISGTKVKPQLHKQGSLYEGLPIPQRKGKVFAGWYTSKTAATKLSTSKRVNGSELASCGTNRQLKLYGAWVTPKKNKATNTSVPILMYHKVTTKSGGENHPLRQNFVHSKNFEKQLDYIKDTNMYLPTWDELYAFINGKLYLPKRSVIVTEDDVDVTWRTHGQQIVAKKKVLTTQFMISYEKKKIRPNPYLISRSHTWDMHRAGANGRGRMVNLTSNQVAADMRKSANYLGVKEVMAYPYGHYNAAAKSGLRKAGFKMARTTKPGRVKIGTDPLELPCVRINFSTSLSSFKRMVG